MGQGDTQSDGIRQEPAANAILRKSRVVLEASESVAAFLQSCVVEQVKLSTFGLSGISLHSPVAIVRHFRSAIHCCRWDNHGSAVLLVVHIYCDEPCFIYCFPET